MLKKIGKNLGAFFIGCIIAILLLELLLQINNPFHFRVKGNEIVLPANQHYEISDAKSTKLDQYIIHTKNSLGFRGPELPEHPESTLSIITVGGSTTECFYLSDDKAWPHVLGKKLEKNFDNIWMNNAGLDGHSTFGHQVLMEDYIAKIRPKLVLFLVGLNDEAVSAFKKYDNNHLQNRQIASIKDFTKTMIDRSEVAGLMWNFMRYHNARTFQIAHQHLDFTTLPHLSHDVEKIHQDVQQHTKNYAPEYAKRLERLIETARANDIEPVFITQPALYGSGIDHMSNLNLESIEVREQTSGRHMWKILEVYNDITRGVGVENDVLVIDLAQAMPKDSHLYYDFVHYTNEGAEKVADIMYKSLCPYLEKKYPKYKHLDCNIQPPI